MSTPESARVFCALGLFARAGDRPRPVDKPLVRLEVKSMNDLADASCDVAALCLKSRGREEPIPLPFPAESIFNRLQKARKAWRIYFHDMPQSLLLGDLWLYTLFHFRRFKQFLADAYAGTLPSYCFIEPHYFTDLFLNNTPNDQHPPHDIIYGEQLIAQVYNAVRGSPRWKRTLLIITYDEHGSCF